MACSKHVDARLNKGGRCSECNKERCKARYALKKEAYIESATNWAKNNKDKRKQISYKYDRANQDKRNAIEATRRATKKNATPNWLTATHKEEICTIYKEAREKGLHVDHVIPLQSKLVCGLHVPWNLQLLSQKENNMKYNKVYD